MTRVKKAAAAVAFCAGIVAAASVQAQAGMQPTESISLNGRPGNDSGGELPGQCPLCGVDGQGTEAQGVEL